MHGLVMACMPMPDGSYRIYRLPNRPDVWQWITRNWTEDCKRMEAEHGKAD